MFLTKAVLTFLIITLIATTIVFSASIENTSNPSQAAQSLYDLAETYYKHANRHLDAKPMRKDLAKEYASKGTEAREKGHKVDRLAKQLRTDTIAGKANHPQARTRSQAKRMAAP